MRRLIALAVATLSTLAFSLVAGASTAAAANASVTISTSGCGASFFCYRPSALSVSDGTTVTWTDTTGFSHTVTRCTSAACNGTGPGSGTDSTFTNGSVAANGTFAHTFHGTGTYNYYCTIHGFGVMHGAITVTAPK